MDEQISKKLRKSKLINEKTERLREELEGQCGQEKVRLSEEEFLNQERMMEILQTERQELRQWFTRTDLELDKFNRKGKYDNLLYNVKQEQGTLKTRLREIYYENVNKNKDLVEKHDKMIQH